MIAYGLLYAAFNDVAVADITVSFAVTRHPRALLEYLQAVRGYAVEHVEPGIYLVHGDTFCVQILERKMLSAEQSLFVRNLRSQLQEEDAKHTLKAYQLLKEINLKNVYLDRLVKANTKIVGKVINMEESLAETLRDVLQGTPAWDIIIGKDTAQEIKIKAQEMAQGMTRSHVIESAKKLLARGLSPAAIAEDLVLPVEMVAALA